MAIKNPYSPLVIPGDWKGTMRNFGTQLSQIITDIYLRLTKAVTISSQTLTSEQQAQARENINAAEYVAVQNITPDVNTTYWTVQSNASKAYGDLVVVNLRVAPKSDFSANSYLNIALPLPSNPSSMGSTSSLVTASNHRGYSITLLANGTLYSTTAFTSSTVIVFTFSYVSTANNISTFIGG